MVGVDDDVRGLADAQWAYEADVGSGDADTSELPGPVVDHRRALSALPAAHPLRLPATANRTVRLRVLFLRGGDAALLEGLSGGSRECLSQALLIGVGFWCGGGVWPVQISGVVDTVPMLAQADASRQGLSAATRRLDLLSQLRLALHDVT